MSQHGKHMRRKKLAAHFREVFENEPSTVTRANVGKKRKRKMKIAIALAKARKSGMNIPKA